jgi:hypothetical protein
MRRDFGNKRRFREPSAERDPRPNVLTSKETDAPTSPRVRHNPFPYVVASVL